MLLAKGSGFKVLTLPPCAPLLLPGHAVLVITARNWLYLVTVGYKISRRLALLAPAPLPARLSGAALTFVGVFLGLWQSVAYTAMDAAFEIVLSKAAVFGLSQCSLVAVVLWQLWSAFVQFRTSTKAWQLGRLAIKEARLLVMAPHALLANNQALVSGVVDVRSMLVLDCAVCSPNCLILGTFGKAWSAEMCIRAASILPSYVDVSCVARNVEPCCFDTGCEF